MKARLSTEKRNCITVSLPSRYRLRGRCRSFLLAFWIVAIVLILGFPFMSAARRFGLGVICRRSWQRRTLAVPAFSVQSRGGQLLLNPTTTTKRDNRPWKPMSSRGGCGTRRQSSSNTHVDIASSHETMHRAYIAVGSNLGDRFDNIASALELLCNSDWHPETLNDDDDDEELVFLVQTSYLHETVPMYITDQPLFLNGVVEVATNLSPHALLRRMKNVEKAMGRNFDTAVRRNGPRPVDMDIVLYETRHDDSNLVQLVLDTPSLVIPHPRMEEREFVLKPLSELVPSTTMHPVLNKTVGEMFHQLKSTRIQQDEASSVRVLPLPRGRMIHFNETVVMGILNVTPDSFSDGGKLKGSVEVAVSTALQLESDGAAIIDVGGESTRPGAKEMLVEEEIRRTIPVIRELRKVSDIPISIDTRHAQVAREAVEAGADIVNDVSGGTFDPLMLATVAQLQVPIVLMHMRGTPETMQSLTEYDDVVSEVADALLERARAAEHAGIPRWMQVLDPGIGFAKDLRGNLLLLKHMSTLRALLRGYPILLGTSRKGFIGKIANVTNPEERDFGTVASCVASLCLGIDDTDDGCNILRVHNVKGMKQGAMVMDAVKRAK